LSALLRIEGLAVSYGSVPAVDGVDLEIEPGELRRLGVLDADQREGMLAQQLTGLRERLTDIFVASEPGREKAVKTELQRLAPRQS